MVNVGTAMSATSLAPKQTEFVPPDAFDPKTQNQLIHFFKAVGVPDGLIESLLSAFVEVEKTNNVSTVQLIEKISDILRQHKINLTEHQKIRIENAMKTLESQRKSGFFKFLMKIFSWIAVIVTCAVAAIIPPASTLTAVLLVLALSLTVAVQIQETVNGGNFLSDLFTKMCGGNSTAGGILASLFQMGLCVAAVPSVSTSVVKSLNHLKELLVTAVKQPFFSINRLVASIKNFLKNVAICFQEILKNAFSRDSAFVALFMTPLNLLKKLLSDFSMIKNIGQGFKGLSRDDLILISSGIVISLSTLGQAVSAIGTGLNDLTKAKSQYVLDVSSADASAMEFKIKDVEDSLALLYKEKRASDYKLMV